MRLSESMRFSALIGIVAAGLGSASAVTYNVAQDFSSTQNGAGNPWSYGRSPTVGGAFTAMTLQTAGPWLGAGMAGWNDSNTFNGTATGLEYYPFILKNSGAQLSFPGNAGPGSMLTIATNALIAHASTQNLAVIRLTAPGTPPGLFNGSFTFTRLQVAPSIVFGQTVGILRNSVPLFSDVISGDGVSKTFNLSGLALSAGDTLDLYVQALPDAGGGTIQVQGQIEAIPEPAAGLLVAGALACCALRRRRLG
jgi:hypothetical protein